MASLKAKRKQHGRCLLLCPERAIQHGLLLLQRQAMSSLEILLRNMICEPEFSTRTPRIGGCPMVGNLFFIQADNIKELIVIVAWLRSYPHSGFKQCCTRPLGNFCQAAKYVISPSSKGKVARGSMSLQFIEMTSAAGQESRMSYNT